MKLLAFVSIVSIALVACAGKDGDPGPTGPTGEIGNPGMMGMMGVAGPGGVWKDSTGVTLTNAIVMQAGAQFALYKADANGVLWKYNPMSGISDTPPSMNPATLTFYYTSVDCSGAPLLSVQYGVGIAIKYGTQLVALPTNSAVTAVYNSSKDTGGTGGCTVETGNTGDLVLKSVLDALPNLSAPALTGTPPFHIEAT